MNTQEIGELIRELPGELTVQVLYDVLLWLVVAALVAGAVRLIRRWVERQIEDVNQRHRIRKWVGYGGFLLVVLVGLVLFLGRFGWMAAFFGILAAGAAIALQDVAKSAVGWMYMSGQPGFGPGARVDVDGVLGEVIDVGVLKTTVLEVGELVHGRQSSGRVGSIPNSKFLSENFLFSPDFSPYVWLELPFLLTYESDWALGVEILEELGYEEYEFMGSGPARGFREMERHYAFKHGPLTPIVYRHAADSGVQLTLRYLTHIRQRRGSADRVTGGMLEAVAREPDLDFAYPTQRFYRRGEESAPTAPGGGSPAGP